MLHSGMGRSWGGHRLHNRDRGDHMKGSNGVGEGGPKIDNAAQGAKQKQKLIQVAPGRREEV